MLKKKLSKKKRVVLIIFIILAVLIALLITANYIIVRYYDYAGSGGGTSSTMGDAIIVVSGDYIQDNNMFGINVGVVVEELSSMEPSLIFKSGNLPLKPNSLDYQVSITLMYCQNSQNIITYGIDLNPADTNCQGILLMHADNTACYMAIVLKKAEPTSISILGEPIQNEGTYYSDVVTTKGCSLTTSIKSRKHWSTSGFPPLN